MPPSTSTAGGATGASTRKMHIPDDPGYSEKFYFTPGDLGFRVFGSPWGKCGLMLCWDQWFPEAARLATLQGAPHPAVSDRYRLASCRRH